MSTVLLDSHVVHWMAAEPEELSPVAAQALDDADELAVADITWRELAWLAHHQRIVISLPLRTWPGRLANQVRSIPLTPAIAATAVELPASFPRDPADRMIYATAIEYGWQLVTKDGRLRSHRHPRAITVW